MSIIKNMKNTKWLPAYYLGVVAIVTVMLFVPMVLNLSVATSVALAVLGVFMCAVMTFLFVKAARKNSHSIR
ncbi:hypothetical protein ACN083_01890 [Rothia sp. CCM 9418]|uniref:hypothetical protein n=1 Tax=Rothia sp. CCM 9418 TaxID=3402661 RepID=UPI003ADD404D